MTKTKRLRSQIVTSKPVAPTEWIEGVICVVRGHKVILDQDMAILYGVETKNLNKAVNRNYERFPEDFGFRLSNEEWNSLRFQIGTSNIGRGGRRYLPFVFTEHGAVMAANILKSKRAVSMSIEIVRAFVRLRHVLASQKEMSRDLAELKAFLLKHSHQNDREFRRVWQAIEKLTNPPADAEDRPMGFDLGQR